MLNHFPEDHRESYTEVKTTVGNTTVTSYYRVRDLTSREHANHEIDEQFDPMVLGVGMLTDAAQWLSASATAFRTVKYLWFAIGMTNALYVSAIMVIPVIGIFTYQYFRHDDKASKALLFWRMALVILGGAV